MKIDFASAALQLRKTEKRADGTAKVSKAAGEESIVESKFPEKMLLQLKGRKNVRSYVTNSPALLYIFYTYK